jgi:hypothetical protein
MLVDLGYMHTFSIAIKLPSMVEAFKRTIYQLTLREFCQSAFI